MSLPEPITYVATADLAGEPVAGEPAAGEPVLGEPVAVGSMSERVLAHRARRPAGWATLELEAGSDLPGALAGLAGTVLVDSVGTWVAGMPSFAVDMAALAESLRSRSGGTVLVSDEVGLGVHPATGTGRLFRDALGSVNRALCDAADRVLLVVAGRCIELPPGAAAATPPGAAANIPR